MNIYCYSHIMKKIIFKTSYLNIEKNNECEIIIVDDSKEDKISIDKRF